MHLNYVSFLEKIETCHDANIVINGRNGVSEWFNLRAFLGTEDSEVHIVHVSRIITAYTLESLSSLT